VRARLRALAAGDVAAAPAPGGGPGTSTGPGGDVPRATREAAEAPTSAGPDPPEVERALLAARRRRAASVALALLLALGAGWFLLQVLRGPEPAPLQLVPGAAPAPTGVGAGPSGAGTPSTPSTSAPPGTTSAPVQQLVVHVLGEVRRPGLVRLSAGARVADAIRAAGGLAPGGGSGALNLARPLVDGEQVLVSAESRPDPAPGGSSGGGAGGSTGAGGAAGPLDLNTATLADLDTLPGVGPVLAGRILAWREANGRFGSVDQLGEVPGIGERTLERLAPLVRV
jgi:competence protein ComEA